MSTANVCDEIAAERAKQEEKGYDAAHDDRQRDGELIRAAITYARYAQSDMKHRVAVAWHGHGSAPSEWPWLDEFYKPEDRRQDLIKAAALLVAEIERLDREMET
jgi:hypothetical protein